MRPGTLLASALCAIALSACGGTGPAAPQAAPPAAVTTPPPAPAFATTAFPNTSGHRGVPLTGDTMSTTVAADGTFAFSNRFEWAIVSFFPNGATMSGSFDGGGPAAFGRGADGALYSGFSVPAGNDLASEVHSGSRTWSFAAYPPLVILGGPDAATWVLTMTGGMVRLNADGTTTTLPVAAPPGDAYDVTLGPDGAFWLAEFDGTIERVPLQGPALRFSVGGQPLSIVAGADGALWFLDKAQSAVRRMTTSGAVRTMFSTSGFTLADRVARGGDGAVWVTNGTTNELIRVAVDGSSARYPAPSAGIQASGVTSAPDGTLYFVETNQAGLLIVHATPATAH
ncbi:MAG TPA: hypothetical protein VK669_09785 [Candidatus Limnocylindrales bacterium]|nr:hypothetical protein [Candidatus Limnocylindrales bacterium]